MSLNQMLGLISLVMFWSSQALGFGEGQPSVERFCTKKITLQQREVAQFYYQKVQNVTKGSDLVEYQDWVTDRLVDTQEWIDIASRSRAYLSMSEPLHDLANQWVILSGWAVNEDIEQFKKQFGSIDRRLNAISDRLCGEAPSAYAMVPGSER